MFTDHLGSVDVITDAAGVIRHSLSFDAWGARRSGENWTAQDITQIIASLSLTGFTQPITTRGFTGHEMVDDMGIIHMNGRIYDAKIARFLQADPVIDGVTNTQGYNRYSYLHNNPLNATDPSGYFSLRKWVGVIVGTVLTFACGPQCGWMAYVAIGGFAGAAGAMAMGGNILKGMAIGAVSAGAFYGVGQYFKGVGLANGKAPGLIKFGGNMLTKGQIAGQIFSHSMVGGTISVLSGGKFGHGFVSAGFTKGVTGSGITEMGSDASAIFGETFAAAVVGGTVSEMTGGKFANGAQTAAFAYLFNELVSNISKPEIMKPTDEERALVAEGRLAEMWKSRCERGDPIGCVGFGTWGSVEDNIALHGETKGLYWSGVGATVRGNAYAGMYEGNPEFRNLTADEQSARMLEFGKAIAHAHLDFTGADRDGQSYFLSARQITDYHQAVFGKYGVSNRFYGGSWGTGVHVQKFEWFYCKPRCDAN